MFKSPYLPAFVWLGIVTALSVMPGGALPTFNLFSADKIGHAAAYAVLTWLLLRGFRSANGRVAQWKELKENKEPIGRPRQIYLGATVRSYSEIGNR